MIFVLKITFCLNSFFDFCVDSTSAPQRIFNKTTPSALPFTGGGGGGGGDIPGGCKLIKLFFEKKKINF